MAQRRRSASARSTQLATTRHRRATGTPPAASPVLGILGKRFFPNVPREEVQRRHFGRSVTLETIDSAIRLANLGMMRKLTDLSLETIRLDGHASALLQKRLNRVAALPWVVEPATGEGINEQMAEDFAGLVRDQLKQIPSFVQRLMDINNAVFHGRSCSEVEWDLHRGVWRCRDLNWIHPRRLSYGPNRDIRIIDLRTEISGFEDRGFAVEQVPYKFVVYRPRLFGDYPEREGLAPRTVFWSYFGRFGVRERMDLLEIFGKPWRIAYPEGDPDGPGVNQEQIDDAYEALAALGGQSTAVLPIAMKLLIAQPTKGAGDVHEAAIDHAEKVLSKLYVGATGTTDAVSTGLGSSIGDAHVNEEDLTVAMDAIRLSEVIEDQVCDAIIVVNHGPLAVSHAPHFRITTDPPMDRGKEVDLLLKILDVGLDVSVAEARERTGVREIAAGEPFLRRIPRLINGQPPLHLPLPETIYPKDVPPAGAIVGLPDTLGGVQPVVPPPAPGQLPPNPQAPKALPPGTEPQLPAAATDDDPNKEYASRLAAKMTEHAVEMCPHLKKNRCWICGVEREHDFDLGADGAPVWAVKWKPIGGSAREPATEEERVTSPTP